MAKCIQREPIAYASRILAHVAKQKGDPNSYPNHHLCSRNNAHSISLSVLWKTVFGISMSPHHRRSGMHPMDLRFFLAY
jgi:hypothetical protein